MVFKMGGRWPYSCFWGMLRSGFVLTCKCKTTSLNLSTTALIILDYSAVLIRADRSERHVNLSKCWILTGRPLLTCRVNCGGSTIGVMVKAMDCGIVVREFVFQSRYYIHFWANTLGKGMNPLILPAMG